MGHDDDEELVLAGPFAGAMQPITVGMARNLTGAASILFFFGALAVTPYLLGWTELEGANRTGLTVNTAAGFITAAGLFFVSRRMTPSWGRFIPMIVAIGFVIAILALSTATYNVGPTFGGVAVFFVETPLLAFLALRFRWAVAVTVLCIAGFAAALLMLDNPPAPAQQIINVAAAPATTGVLIGGMAARLERSRRAERDLKQNLAERVAEQVDELERTGRLKRFLSPQVAELVTSPSAEVLDPHRRDIAVFFVDLRRFSQFTNRVTPDEVVEVLGDYYQTVGDVLQHYGATVGGLDGDGIMAYVGDPVPRDDAPDVAIAMARDVARALDARVDGWRAGDHTLGYGIGLSFGPATLGVMGFEGLYDYTAVGAVVNLAARLCAEAKHGEIVVDASFKSAASLDGQLRHRGDVDLKGFGVTETYLVEH